MNSTLNVLGSISKDILENSTREKERSKKERSTKNNKKSPYKISDATRMEWHRKAEIAVYGRVLTHVVTNEAPTQNAPTQNAPTPTQNVPTQNAPTQNAQQNVPKYDDEHAAITALLNVLATKENVILIIESFNNINYIKRKIDAAKVSFTNYPQQQNPQQQDSQQQVLEYNKIAELIRIKNDLLDLVALIEKEYSGVLKSTSDKRYKTFSQNKQLILKEIENKNFILKNASSLSKETKNDIKTFIKEAEASIGQIEKAMTGLKDLEKKNYKVTIVEADDFEQTCKAATDSITDIEKKGNTLNQFLQKSLSLYYLDEALADIKKEIKKKKSTAYRYENDENDENNYNARKVAFLENLYTELNGFKTETALREGESLNNQTVLTKIKNLTENSENKKVIEHKRTHRFSLFNLNLFSIFNCKVFQPELTATQEFVQNLEIKFGKQS